MNRQGKVTFNKGIRVFLDGRRNLNVNDVKKNGLRMLFFYTGLFQRVLSVIWKGILLKD
jgi:hypothetical protein